MTDRIFEIGKAGIESSDQQVKKLMDNMVGADIPGFKEQGVVVRGFPLQLEEATRHLSSMKPQAERLYYDNSPGALIKTGGKLDVALGSEGYFVVLGGWGQGFTRDGRFQLDKEGRLLTVAGNYPVLGRNGPIVLPPGADVAINQTGEILVDGVVVDHLSVMVPENQDSLDTVNGSIFKCNNPRTAMVSVDSPRVVQGYIESSNVSIVTETTRMIELEKIYNINSKIVQTRSDMLSRSMELGRATQ